MALPAKLPSEAAERDKATTLSSSSWTVIAAQCLNAMALDEFIYNYRKKVRSSLTHISDLPPDFRGIFPARFKRHKAMGTCYGSLRPFKKG